MIKTNELNRDFEPSVDDSELDALLENDCGR
jgi:hypothetical protein